VITLREREDLDGSHGISHRAVFTPAARLRMEPIESTLYVGEKTAGMRKVRNGPVRVRSLSDSRAQNGDETLNNPQKNPGGLDGRLSRYRRVLSFVAYRVLSNQEEAEDAVRNCLLSAYNAPRFECEGAFRSWLVRILIDEALLILYKKRTGVTD
jgi:hypothetical protein